MAQLFSNAARAELESTINDTDTTFEVNSLPGVFPVATVGNKELTEGDWFKAILQDLDGIEIVYVRSHDGEGLTFENVLRGQEGTVAREFAVGSTIGFRQTAENARVWEAKANAEDLTALAQSINDTIMPELAALETSITDTIVPQIEARVAIREEHDLYPDVDKAKLSLIEDEATKNDTDAELRDRATHTGTAFKPVSTDVLLKVGDDLGIDTLAGPVTVTLPASPVEGDMVSVTDTKSTWKNNTPILARNGSLIVGLDEDMELNVDNARVSFIYTTDLGWKVF